VTDDRRTTDDKRLKIEAVSGHNLLYRKLAVICLKIVAFGLYSNFLNSRRPWLTSTLIQL